MDSESSRSGKVRRTAQQFQQLVAQFHRGGQTMDQFARQQGVALSTVKRWLRMQRPPKAPRLIEVQRGPQPGPGPVGRLRLANGLVLELEHGFAPGPIAQLVQLLAGR
jgi:hypothetical protein